MSENKLTYEALLRGEVRDNGYFGAPESEGIWLAILPVSEDSAAQTTGWKFHLSVVRDAVPAAWNIMVETLQDLQAIGQTNGQNYCLHAKVATPWAAEKLSEADNPQRGKMITLFELAEWPLPVWQAFLSEIEARFLAEGLQSGLAVQNDQPVPGSRFASYSQGRDANGERIEPEDRPKLIAVNNPFATLTVDPKGLSLNETLEDYRPSSQPSSRPVHRAFSLPPEALEILEKLTSVASQLKRQPQTEAEANAYILSTAGRDTNWETDLQLPNPTSGEPENVIRTIPGYFEKKELALMHAALVKAGVAAYVDTDAKPSVVKAETLPAAWSFLFEGDENALNGPFGNGDGAGISLVVLAGNEAGTEVRDRIEAILDQAGKSLLTILDKLAVQARPSGGDYQN